MHMDVRCICPPADTYKYRILLWVSIPMHLVLVEMRTYQAWSTVIPEL